MVIFLILLASSYVLIAKRKKPITVWHKVKLLTLIAVTLKAGAIGGFGLLAVYWFVPQPNVLQTTPSANAQEFPTTNKIEIVFDRPVAREALEKQITPEIPGNWMFENSIYSTHLYRKLVFYPTYNLTPDTTYTVHLTQIKNMSTLSAPYAHTFRFTTQKAPGVIAVSPVSGQELVAISAPITVTLSHPNTNMSQFEFELVPQTPVDISLDDTQNIYTIQPKVPLEQGTTYTLRIKKTE